MTCFDGRIQKPLKPADLLFGNPKRHRNSVDHKTEPLVNLHRDPVRLLLVNVNKETGRDKILSLNKSCCDGGRPLGLATKTVVEINKRVMTHRSPTLNQRAEQFGKTKTRAT